MHLNNLIRTLLKVLKVNEYIYTIPNCTKKLQHFIIISASIIRSNFHFFLIVVPSFENVEATPLESLPGNIDVFEHGETRANVKEKKCSNSPQQYQGLEISSSYEYSYGAYKKDFYEIIV